MTLFLALAFLAVTVGFVLSYRNDPNLPRLAVATLLIAWLGFLSANIAVVLWLSESIQSALVLAAFSSLFQSGGVLFAVLTWLETKAPRTKSLQFILSIAVIGPIGCFLAVVIGNAFHINDNLRTKEETASFPKHGFTLRVPGRPWVRVTGPAANPDAAIHLRRANSHTHVVVVSEPDITNGSTNQVISLLQTGLAQNSDPPPRFTPVRAFTTNGLEWLHYEANVSEANRPFVLIFYVAIHQDRVFKLITLDRASRAEPLRKTALEFLSRFAPLDRSDDSEVELNSPYSIFVSDAFGFRVDLTGLRWIESHAAKVQNPHAAFAAATEGPASLWVVPIWLDQAQPDLDALARAFFAAVCAFPLDQIILEDSQVTPDGANRYYTCSLDSDPQLGPTTACLRVTQRGEWACLVGSVRSAAGSTEPLRQLVDRFSWVEARPGPPADHRAPERVAEIWNQLGLAYFSGKPDAAVPYFQRAIDLDPAEPVYPENLAHALRNAEQFEESLSAATRHAGAFTNRYEAHLELARSHHAAGDFASAASSFGRAVQLRPTDDSVWEEFLTSLHQSDRGDEALATIDAELEREPRLALHIVKARLLGRMERYAESVACLQDLRLRKKWHPDLSIELIQALHNASDFEAALAVSDEFLTAQIQPQTFTLWRAQSLWKLHRHREARAAFEQALRYHPNDPDILNSIEHLPHSSVRPTINRSKRRSGRCPSPIISKASPPPAPTPTSTVQPPWSTAGFGWSHGPKSNPNARRSITKFPPAPSMAFATSTSSNPPSIPCTNRSISTISASMMPQAAWSPQPRSTNAS